MKKIEVMSKQGIGENLDVLTAVWQKQCDCSHCKENCCEGHRITLAEKIPPDMEAASLAELPKGKSGVVRGISADNEEAKRLMAFGFLEDTTVESLYQSPSGNPVAYCVRGVVLALREEDAKKIIIK